VEGADVSQKPVAIVAVGAKDLKGSSSTYCTVHLNNNPHNVQKSSKLKKTHSPQWDSYIGFEDIGDSTSLEIGVWDCHLLSKDKKIGTAELVWADLEGFPTNGWTHKVDLPLGDGCGSIQLTVCPSYGPEMSFEQRKATKLKDWHSKTLKLQGKGQLSCLVPSDLLEQPNLSPEITFSLKTDSLNHASLWMFNGIQTEREFADEDAFWEAYQLQNETTTKLAGMGKVKWWGEQDVTVAQHKAKFAYSLTDTPQFMMCCSHYLINTPPFPLALVFYSYFTGHDDTKAKDNHTKKEKKYFTNILDSIVLS